MLISTSLRPTETNRGEVKALPVSANKLPGLEIKGSGFALPAEFWTDFVEHYWEQRPLVLKQPFITPLATAAQVFAGLTRVGDEGRAGDRYAPARLYVEQALQQGDILKHIPAARDGSISGYAARMGRSFNKLPFGLVVNNYQAYDALTFLRLREFLRGLYELTGFPANVSEAIVFLGNYEKTPFGLHKDQDSNCTFVIAGRKRILAWPAECFPEPRKWNSLSYERFRDKAIVLEGEPGDLLYWPSTYWHIGEGNGDLALTLSLVIRLQKHPQDIFPALASIVTERLRAVAEAEVFPLYPQRLQAGADQSRRIARQASKVLRVLSRDPQIEQTMRVEWLNRLTSYGFDRVPPPLPQRRLANNEVVCGEPHHPIVWLLVEDREIICSANGHSFSVTAHPNILALLARLNGGASCSVKQLIAEHAGTVEVNEVEFEATPGDIRRLLGKLFSLRAITT
jgi:50S ribosomal protein L16 3-hydroxylase